MSPIAEELDAKLKILEPQAASSLEKLVRNAIELLDVRTTSGTVRCLPNDFFSNIAREFGAEPYERPPQGEYEKRQDW